MIHLALSAFSPSILFLLLFTFTRLFRLARFRLPWTTLSAVVIAVLLVTAGAYLVLPILLEDAETTMASVSALSLRGRPMYPSHDAAERYILLYGPIAYLGRAIFFPLLGINLFSFKLVGFLCLVTSLFGLYRISRNFVPPRSSLIAIGAAAVVFFRYLPVVFWGRCDPLILCATVLSICASLSESALLASLGNAISLACIVNLKVSGIAYILPLFGFFFSKHGWRAAVATAGLLAVAVIAPFALPSISLANYASAVREAGRHGLVAEFLLRNLQYSLLLLLPVLSLLFPRSLSARLSFAQKLYLALIIIGLVLSSIVGAKNGAGSYHLLPYTALILHLYLWISSNRNANESTPGFSQYALPWIIVMLVLSANQVREVVSGFSFAGSGYQAVAEIQSIEQNFRGQTVELGVGQTYEDPRARYGYVTTFDGQPYTLSYSALRDLQFGGVNIPPATNEYIADCRTRVWLIPQGDTPFTATNTYYAEYHPAFDDTFRQTFLSHYRKVKSGRFYDVWACENTRK